jgi:5-methylcytosine-specific restriction endonuclease McrA
MAEAALDLFGHSAKARGQEPRRPTDQQAACDKCGKLHWRRDHQMVATKKYCSRECQLAVSAKVTLTCGTCGTTFIKFRSQAARGAKIFCSAQCRSDYGLRTIACCWPGCENTVPCRRTIATARDGGDEYKVELVKRGQYTKYPFCPHHRALVDKYLGPKSRFTGGRSRMLADPEHEYDHRALSSRFTRMIIFERAGRRCESCSTELGWNAPFKTWEMDHRVPIFRGGKTKLSNMQILCANCHSVKSSAEKSEVATSRWHSERERGTRWMTHYEKDQLITDLRQQIADLQARLQT